MGFRSIAEGSILADGSEQTILEVTQSGRFAGYVSLREMQAGDTVYLSQYVKIDGTYDRYRREPYQDVQTDPAIYITPKEVVTGMKITIQQTVGTFREIDFNFIIEELPGGRFKA